MADQREPVGEDVVTNGAYQIDDFGPIGDQARMIASYSEGAARLNVYHRAKIELQAAERRGEERMRERAASSVIDYCRRMNALGKEARFSNIVPLIRSLDTSGGA